MRRTVVPKDLMRVSYSIFTALAIALTAGVRGQTVHSWDTSGEPTAPTAFVPISARVLLSVHNMREVESALKRTHAWRMVALASGETSPEVSKFDLRAAVGALLGGRSKVKTGALMRTQVAVAARSLSQLDGAVWYLRVPDDRTFDVWFPPDKRRESRISKDARLIKMPDGVIACVRDRLVALGRRFEPDSLLRETVRLMASRGSKALSASPPYQRLSAYLPGHPIATTYLVADPEAASTDGGGDRLLGDLFPRMNHVMIGMFERNGRIDLAVRGTRVTPAASRSLPAPIVDRLQRLPHTTILASAVSFNAEDLPAMLDGKSGSYGTLARYLRVLMSLRARAVGPQTPFPALGGGLIFLWDQDFRPATSTLQLALLVHAPDARALVGEVSAIAQKLIEFTHAVDPVDPAHVPAVSLDVHLGTPIARAKLDSYARRSSFPIARFLANVEICWAAQDDWLIVTLSRDHLERILEAAIGLAPTLASVRDARPVWRLGEKRTAVTVVQADAAAEVVGGWLHAQAAGQPSLLTPRWIGAQASDGEPAPLGVEADPSSPAGIVIVANIQAGSPALGRLQVGDKVVGIDGELLDFALPDRDLERRWNLGGPASARTVRVLRGDTTVDVRLDGRPRTIFSPGLSRDVVSAMRELVEVGRAVPFAGLSVFETDENHYAAMLSLRFAGSQDQDVSSSP